MKTFLTILITLVVAGGVAGAGVFYYDKSKCDDAKDKLRAEVKSAESSCATSESATSASNSDCAVYSYSNSTYGISFDYPKNWLVEGREDKAAQSGDPYLSFMVSDTPTLQQTDMPPAIAIYFYNSISDLDDQNMGVSDLKDYLDKYSDSSSSAYYKNVTTATVAGKSGYSADEAGNGMFEDGKYYFREFTGGKILKIWDQAEDAGTKVVIDSLKV
jgi:uncharacterized protein YxeA